MAYPSSVARFRRGVVHALAGILLLPASLALAAPQFILQPGSDDGARLDALETKKVRIALQYGLGYLPLMVMRQLRLVEKHASAAGLGPISVIWNRYPSGKAMNSALKVGLLDFASGGAVPLIQAWNKTRDGMVVRGVGGLGMMPVYMVTNDPSIHSVKDINPGDRIAVPAVETSLQAVLLQMATAKAFGAGHYARLDAATVAMSHPDGLRALLANKITAIISGPPFQNEALQNPSMHRVFSSYQLLGGQSTYNFLWTTGEFREKYPKTYRAIYDALREAMDIIGRNPTNAAEIYLQQSNSPLSVAFVRKLITDSDVRFTPAPRGIEKIALFLYHTGAIRRAPMGWEDLFFDDVVQDYPGPNQPALP